jgi:hypothetical protein
MWGMIHPIALSWGGGFQREKACHSPVIITSACFPIPTIIQKIALLKAPYTIFPQSLTSEIAANFYFNRSVNKVSLHVSLKIFGSCKLNCILEFLIVMGPIAAVVLVFVHWKQNDFCMKMVKYEQKMVANHLRQLVWWTINKTYITCNVYTN